MIAFNYHLLLKNVNDEKIHFSQLQLVVLSYVNLHLSSTLLTIFSDRRSNLLEIRRLFHESARKDRWENVFPYSPCLREMNFMMAVNVGAERSSAFRAHSDRTHENNGLFSSRCSNIAWISESWRRNLEESSLSIKSSSKKRGIFDTNTTFCENY